MAAACGNRLRARLRFNQSPLQIGGITGAAALQNQQKVDGENAIEGSSAMGALLIRP